MHEQTTVVVVVKRQLEIVQAYARANALRGMHYEVTYKCLYESALYTTTQRLCVLQNRNTKQNKHQEY